MDVTSATTAAATSATKPQGNTAAEVSSDFETFLKMLTVQMKNQDPLEPMASEDLAVQLATFSGVEQQVKTNELLGSLGAQMNLMGMAQLSSWVGMEARAPIAAYYDGQPITLLPNPPASADSTILVVKDENDIEIERKKITVSDDPIAWSGVLGASNAPEGLYSFTLESYSNGAEISSEQMEVYSRIIEARGEAGQILLVTEGGVEISADLVSALREPVDPV